MAWRIQRFQNRDEGFGHNVLEGDNVRIWVCGNRKRRGGDVGGLRLSGQKREYQGLGQEKSRGGHRLFQVGIGVDEIWVRPYEAREESDPDKPGEVLGTSGVREIVDPPDRIDERVDRQTQFCRRQFEEVRFGQIRSLLYDLQTVYHLVPFERVERGEQGDGGVP